MDVKKLSFATSLCIYLLIVVGGYVSQSGSGLACPDWPTCHGRLVPPLEGPALIEYSHRLLASVTGLLIFATGFLVWKRHRSGGLVKLAYAIPLLLVVQIFIGAFTVQSKINPLISTAHLALAVAIFGLSLSLTHLLWNKA